MRNYGEELAYWYLRLNGFFVLDNFVYHRISKNNQNGDADLLAIRLPNVKGEIGGRMNDWDEILFKYLGEYEIAAVLCEVKTGKNPDFNKAFGDRKLEYALNRIGFAKNDIDQILEQQKSHYLLKSRDKKFLKLGISEYVKNRKLHNDSKLPFLVFSLQHIEKFICNRINRYSEKYSARHMFPSSLLQYMMYKQRENS